MIWGYGKIGGYGTIGGNLKNWGMEQLWEMEQLGEIKRLGERVRGKGLNTVTFQFLVVRDAIFDESQSHISSDLIW